MEMRQAQKVYGGVARVGGIVGTSFGNIENCTVNSGITITATGSPDNLGNKAIGGICGELIEGSVTKCTNYAIINNTGTGKGVGGIVGVARYAEHKIESCGNTGIITSTSQYVGGVVGIVASDPTNTTLKTYISKCKNTGNVTGLYGVGGIVGKLGQNAAITDESKKTKISECYNTGTITGTGHVSTEYSSVGGIAGTTNQYNFIEYSYNKGSVKGTYSSGSDCVGGITGYLKTGSTIKGCYNTGSVSVTKNIYYVGGIAGKNSTSSSDAKGSMTNISGTYCHANAYAYLVGGSTASNSYKNTGYQFTTTLSPEKLTGNYTYWKVTSTYPTLINNPE